MHAVLHLEPSPGACLTEHQSLYNLNRNNVNETRNSSMRLERNRTEILVDRCYMSVSPSRNFECANYLYGSFFLPH